MTVLPANDDSPDEDPGFVRSTTVVAPLDDAEPVPFDLTVVVCDCFLPENVSMMLIAAGPSSTMNSVGRMKMIIGTVSRAGRRAAFSSARVIRAVAQFGGQDAQRLGQRRAEFGGLLQCVHDAADRRRDRSVR